MAGLLSVPATRGDRSEAGRREGRKGRGGRAGGERRAKEGRRNGGEGAGPRGSGCEVRPRSGAETSGWRPGGVPEGCGSGARRERAVCRPPADQPGPGRTGTSGALLVRPWGPSPDCGRGCLRVLLVCGRAPGCALSPGPRGSACMGAAWVGPLRWTQRAGGTPPPHSPQAADRSGGRTAPPGPGVEPVPPRPQPGRRATAERVTGLGRGTPRGRALRGMNRCQLGHNWLRCVG